MANKLVTTGTNNDPVETERANGETTAHWVNRHAGAIASAGVSSATLTTTWNDAECSAATERDPSWSDSEYIDEHESDIAAEMENCVPT